MRTSGGSDRHGGGTGGNETERLATIDVCRWTAWDIKFEPDALVLEG